MKARTIQPLFSADGSQLDQSFQWTVDALEACDPSLDIIVIPEYSDVPGKATPSEFFEKVKVNTPVLLKTCSETAKRCSSLLFCGAVDMSGEKPRNGLFVFDREGKQIGVYYKEHLTKGEWSKRGMDKSYSESWNPPYMLEIEGLKFAFLICYDFYFYENFSNLARYSPDIIIGSSHQRSDRHDILDLIDSFLAYNTGAYVVRSSVSMGEDSPVGGCSSVISPSGKVLGSLFSHVGVLDVCFDPCEKYLKPAGYGNPLAKHCEYIEIGRRPWKYRPAGSAIVPSLWESSYPRVCLVGGYSKALMRKNPLASYGAAVAAGVKEISVSITGSSDLELFEKILHKLSCHVLMNVRLSGVDKELIRRMCKTIFDYDASQYVYFTSSDTEILKAVSEVFPNSELCLCLSGSSLESAVALGCKAVQVDSKAFSEVFAKRAHSMGCRCNVIAKGSQVRLLFDAGADVVLTDKFINIE